MHWLYRSPIPEGRGVFTCCWRLPAFAALEAGGGESAPYESGRRQVRSADTQTETDADHSGHYFSLLFLTPVWRHNNFTLVKHGRYNTHCNNKTNIIYSVFCVLRVFNYLMYIVHGSGFFFLFAFIIFSILALSIPLIFTYSSVVFPFVLDFFISFNTYGSQRLHRKKHGL
jgi:hypothetical protein